MDLVTQASEPARWASPSVLVAAVSDGRSVLTSSGWFTSLLAWENRFPAAPTRAAIDGLDLHVVGDGKVLDADSHDQVQVEVVLDGLEGDEVVDSFLRRFVPSVILDELPHLPSHESVTVNANRDTSRPESWSGLGACFIDVPVNSLPSTRGGSLPIISATRWARVIRWRAGMLVLWTPPTGYWDPADVRWPHHAVPARSRDALLGMLAPSLSAEDRVLGWFQEATGHERCFLESWTTELEIWESRLFAQLAKGADAYATMDLPSLQRDIGVLAGYLDRVRVSQRFYLRRAEVSSLVAGVPGLVDFFGTVQTSLNADLRLAREGLRSAFDLLSSVSQGAQAYTSAESQKTQERLNSLITTVTAVLFVPSLIAGIYGTNVRELSPGSTGSIPELLALMLALSLCSLGALAWGRLGRPTPLSGAALAAGLSLTFAIVLRHESSVAAISVALVGVVFAALLIFAIQLVQRFSRARSRRTHALPHRPRARHPRARTRTGDVAWGSTDP